MHVCTCMLFSLCTSAQFLLCWCTAVFDVFNYLISTPVVLHPAASPQLLHVLRNSSLLAGDSRAVLVRGGEAVAATDDHRPAHREDEKVGVSTCEGA